MEWHAVNAMIWESATHRVRRVGGYWYAERKGEDGARTAKIGGSFHKQHDAQLACDADAYQNASGR